MKTWTYNTFILFGLIGAFTMHSCAYGPMQAPTSAGLVVYTKGAQQHTATVQIARPPTEVYAAMLRIVAKRPDLTVINNDEKRYLLEVAKGEKRLTGQATELDAYSTLFFIWADAGASGQSGQNLALTAMRELCAELKVECKMEGI
ncbi:MAG: hypothetical protein AMJ68_11560 [Acidithiobacillales bacterium SG8_45]|nr:MAG: hypothetical protein AMJ68_11560 [Acidithiobacillales bacterium SG8_45]